MLAYRLLTMAYSIGPRLKADAIMYQITSQGQLQEQKSRSILYEALFDASHFGGRCSPPPYFLDHPDSEGFKSRGDRKVLMKRFARSGGGLYGP